MVELQKNNEKFKEAGLQLVAISYDSLDALEKFGKEKGIEYPLLSDEGSKVIDAYGIRNIEAKDSRIDGVPYPGAFLIDEKGIVRAKFFHEGYKERHTSAEIIEAAKMLD